MIYFRENSNVMASRAWPIFACFCSRLPVHKVDNFYPCYCTYPIHTKSHEIIIKSYWNTYMFHEISSKSLSQNVDTPQLQNIIILSPWVKFRKYVWFWGDQKIHIAFCNGCLWENRFWSIKKWRRQISQKYYCTIIFYIRVIWPTLELSQWTQGCLWYLQISCTAHGADPLPVGRSVNIRAILRFTRKVPT